MAKITFEDVRWSIGDMSSFLNELTHIPGVSGYDMEQELTDVSSTEYRQFAPIHNYLTVHYDGRKADKVLVRVLFALKRWGLDYGSVQEPTV